MRKIAKGISKPAGLPPGSAVYIGEGKSHRVKITVIDYNKAGFTEKVVKTPEECAVFKNRPSVTWVNVDGVHETGIVEKIGAVFGLHPLILEAILNTGQRPKMEDFEEYIYLVLKMLYFDRKKTDVKAEQVSFVLGPNFVVSFQEVEGDVFNPVRERIRTAKGKMRELGADYLAYSLIDAIVDSYFGILEELGEEIEVLEERIVSNPKPAVMREIHALKREIIFLRRSVWPLREIISGLERGGSKLVKPSTRVYLRDLYDHTIQVIDNIETFRDMIAGMLDIYLSSVSNKMNEIMKVLTIIATIFIPLTFIVGVYGMNFKYMPELGWRLGYYTVWSVMISVAAVMVYYFRRKKWI